MKKAPILALCSALLLTGCSGATATIKDKSDTIMTIGNTTITKEDEYKSLKISNGSDMTMELVKQAIYKKEVKVTKKMKKSAKETLESYESSMDNFEDQLKSLGYSSKKEYKNKVLIPSLQAEALTKKYFTDAKTEITKKYKPSKAKIIQCENKANAKKALKALKKGTDVTEVANQYMVDSATFYGEEQLVTTETSSLPTRLINKLYKAKKAGVIDEVFDNTSSGTSYAYVAVLVDNDYDNIKSDVISELSSEDDITEACLIYYLKKYNFEVHDQDIFDDLKTNNPTYLVSRPDLAESDDD
jgi:foldase protein PrsA